MEELSDEINQFLDFDNVPRMTWLESEEGIQFLNSSKSLPWLLSASSEPWINNRGEVWLQRDDCMIARHLSAPRGLLLLEKYPDVRGWLTKTEKGQYWLKTKTGLNWLRSEVGQNWLKSPAAKKWMNVPKELLSET